MGKGSKNFESSIFSGGGIVDGKSIYAALALRIESVLVSPRFLATRK